MGLDDDIAAIERQERALRLAHFNEDDAWRLGGLLRAEAARRALPVAIEIRGAGRVLFLATLPGSSPDNADWLRRKANLCLRLNMASYRYGRHLERSGAALGTARGLDPADYAAHGGAFPVHVAGTGVVAALTVSGLAEREDHRIAVWGLCRHLGRDPSEIDLPET